MNADTTDLVQPCGANALCGPDAAQPIDMDRALADAALQGQQPGPAAQAQDSAQPGMTGHRHAVNWELIRSLTRSVQMGHAFQINTPVCQRYLLDLTTWLERGDQGGIVFGRQRLGKTSATRWALKQLRNVLGHPVPWCEVPVRKGMAEGAFFQYLLRCVKHKHYRSGNRGDKRDRLSEYLISRAQRSKLRTFILFFDEAHRLTIDHYDWLLSVANELDAKGLRLFCLLVGQAPLLDVKAALSETNEDQLVERFMLGEFAFRGIHSATEAAGCLGSFDATVYPVGGGKRFPEHYAPELCESGFHLQDIGQLFWEAFCDTWTSAKLQGTPTVPMAYFTRAMLRLLEELAKKPRHRVAAADVALAVARSDYARTLKASEIEDSAETES